jgi:hypothetical protein
MKQLKSCLVAIMVMAVGVGGIALAQEEEEKKKEEPRIKITGAPEGANVKIIKRERPTSEIEPPAESPPAREMTAEDEAWFKAGMAGPPHEILKQMEGRWEAKVRYWPEPGAEPQTGRGSVMKEMMLGGRFLQTTYKGEWMGESYLGIGFEGYDNIKEKYVSIWMDSMSTMVYFSEGTVDESGKVWTYYGEYTDPVTKKLKTNKSVLTIRSLSMHTMETYEQKEDGEWIKVMEIIYGSIGTR